MTSSMHALIIGGGTAGPALSLFLEKAASHPPSTKHIRTPKESEEDSASRPTA